MPTSPMTRCSYPGCSTLVPSGRCAEHTRPAWENKPASHADRGRSRSRETALRRRVLREEPRCRRCGAPSTEADHIVPLHLRGARWARSNMQGLCGPCHKEKTQAESIAARRRRAAAPATVPPSVRADERNASNGATGRGAVPRHAD